jgi:SAM-dependent methyltransferase
MVNLEEIADNLVQTRSGFWTAPGHEDLRFIEADPTEWHVIEEASFWYTHRNRVFLTVISKHPPQGPIFEIGAGNGTVTMALQEAGYPVVGIEPTVRFAENASRRGVRQVVCATLEDAQFTSGTLPNVGMFDVLEHIQDDLQQLRRVRKVMRRGGRIYCAVPAWKLLWSAEDAAAEHVRRYSLGELQAKLGAAGFDVEFTTYYFRSLVLPIFIMRSLPSLLGVRGPRTAASSRRDHVLKPGLVSRSLQHLLDREIQILSSGRRIAVGASYLIVAKAI